MRQTPHFHMVYVLLLTVPPIALGAWSMALVLLQPPEYYNPRRACAARVTVRNFISLSVCLLPRYLPPRATRRQKCGTKSFSATLA